MCIANGFSGKQAALRGHGGAGTLGGAMVLPDFAGGKRANPKPIRQATAANFMSVFGPTGELSAPVQG